MPIKEPQTIEPCIGCKLCVLACSFAKNKSLSVRDAALRIKEKNNGFLAEFDPGTCTGRGECVRACPRNCLALPIKDEP